MINEHDQWHIGFDNLTEEAKEELLEHIRGLLVKENPIEDWLTENKGKTEDDYQDWIDENVLSRLDKFDHYDNGIIFSI